MGISMAILGHEECEVCVAYKNHKAKCECEFVCKMKTLKDTLCTREDMQKPEMNM